jgi:hypothetical protein
MAGASRIASEDTRLERHEFLGVVVLYMVKYTLISIERDISKL